MARLKAERTKRAESNAERERLKERARVEYVHTSESSHSSALNKRHIVELLRSGNAYVARMDLLEWLNYQCGHEYLSLRASGACTVSNGSVFPHDARTHVMSSGPPAPVQITEAQEGCAWDSASKADMVLCEVNGDLPGDHRLLLLYRNSRGAYEEYGAFQSLFVVARGGVTPRSLKVPVRVDDTGYVITVDAGKDAEGRPPLGWVFAFLYFCVLFREFLRSNSSLQIAISRSGRELVTFLGACAKFFTGNICRATLDLVSSGKYAAFDGSRVIEQPIIPTNVKLKELVDKRERAVDASLRTFRSIAAFVIKGSKVYKTHANGSTDDTLVQMAAITPPMAEDIGAPWNHVYARGQTYMGVNVIQWLRSTFRDKMPSLSDGKTKLSESQIAAWSDANSTIRAVTVDLTSVYGGYTHPYNGSHLSARDLGRDPIHDKRSLHAFKPMVLVMAHFPVWLLDRADASGATFHVLMFIIYNDDDVSIRYTSPFKPTSAVGAQALPRLIDAICVWMLEPRHRIGSGELIRFVVDDMLARSVAESDEGVKIHLGNGGSVDALLVKPAPLPIDAREVRDSITRAILSVSEKISDIGGRLDIKQLRSAFDNGESGLRQYWRMDPYLLLSSIGAEMEIGEYEKLCTQAGWTKMAIERGLVDRSLAKPNAYYRGVRGGDDGGDGGSPELGGAESTIGAIRVRSYRVVDRMQVGGHDLDKLREHAIALLNRKEGGYLGRKVPGPGVLYHHPVSLSHLTIPVVEPGTEREVPSESELPTEKRTRTAAKRIDRREMMARLRESISDAQKGGRTEDARRLVNWLNALENEERVGGGARAEKGALIKGLKPLFEFGLAPPSFESDAATKKAFRIAMLTLIDDAELAASSDLGGLKQRLALFELNEVARELYKIDKRISEIKQQKERGGKSAWGVSGEKHLDFTREEQNMQRALDAKFVQNADDEMKRLEDQRERINKIAKGYVVVHTGKHVATDAGMGASQAGAELFGVDEVPVDEEMHDPYAPSSHGAHSDNGSYAASSDPLSGGMHAEQQPTHGPGFVTAAGSSDSSSPRVPVIPDPKRRRLMKKTKINVERAIGPVDVGAKSVGSHNKPIEGDTPRDDEIPVGVDAPPITTRSDATVVHFAPVKIVTMKQLLRENATEILTYKHVSGGLDDVMVDPRSVSDEIVQNIYEKVMKKYAKDYSEADVNAVVGLYDGRKRNELFASLQGRGDRSHAKRDTSDASKFAV